MRHPNRRQLSRVADVAIPVLVGVFLALVVLDEGRSEESSALILLGVVLALGQGAALWWRRRYPERVMVATLAGGLGVQLIAPEIVLP